MRRDLASKPHINVTAPWGENSAFRITLYTSSDERAIRRAARRALLVTKAAYEGSPTRRNVLVRPLLARRNPWYVMLTHMHAGKKVKDLYLGHNTN